MKFVCSSVLVTRLCLTLCDSVGCSPPGSSVHGILQARIPQWVAIPSSRGSSQFGDQTCRQNLHCRQILYCLSHQGNLYATSLLASLCMLMYLCNLNWGKPFFFFGEIVSACLFMCVGGLCKWQRIIRTVANPRLAGSCVLICSFIHSPITQVPAKLLLVHWRRVYYVFFQKSSSGPVLVENWRSKSF